MPTYRVYYAEREATEADQNPFYGLHLQAGAAPERRPYKETEWEEEIEARDAAQALVLFFEAHAVNRRDIRRLDDAGESYELRGLEDFDPEKTYIWIEGDKLMEYQGMDEATPGIVTCPLCGGAGQVDEEVAEEYEAEFEEEEEEEEEEGEEEGSSR